MTFYFLLTTTFFPSLIFELPLVPLITEYICLVFSGNFVHLILPCHVSVLISLTASRSYMKMDITHLHQTLVCCTSRFVLGPILFALYTQPPDIVARHPICHQSFHLAYIEVICSAKLYCVITATLSFLFVPVIFCSDFQNTNKQTETKTYE